MEQQEAYVFVTDYHSFLALYKRVPLKEVEETIERAEQYIAFDQRERRHEYAITASWEERKRIAPHKWYMA